MTAQVQPDSSPRWETHIRDRFSACLLGGAVGDALGGAVEFMSRSQILDRFGQDGITDYAEAYGGKGTITDDTQMTLFTAEGLLRGRMRGVSKGITSFDHTVAGAYLRWLATQRYENHHISPVLDGWLFQQRELHSLRAPGMTCLSALRDYEGDPGIAVNDSKGCGGVMRVAPGWVAEEALEISVYCALVAKSFEQAIVLAVNHDGDSDSTGAITGNILGVMLGTSVIPERWLEPLEIRGVIEIVASDLWTCQHWTSGMDNSELWKRYPGC